MDLGEGVSRMNSTLEVLNNNLGALNNFVKGSYGSRNKRKSRTANRQPSEDDETDSGADDEGSTVREYKPPKRKSRKENHLHVWLFLIRRLPVMLTVLQRLVRAHTCVLLHKKPRDPLTCDVTQEEADDFDSSAGYPCTKEIFRLHLVGTPAHKWNRAAAEVFAESFREKRPDFKHDEVKGYFLTHLRTLISRFKKEQQLKGLTQPEQESAAIAAATQTRRSTRKHNVSRVTPVLHPPPLRAPKALPPPHRGRQNDKRLEAVRTADRCARARGYVFRRDR